MEGALHRFVRLLRLHGVRVSVSEALDAMHAAAQPGVLAERELLRSALMVTLVKDRRDVDTFDLVFDRPFTASQILGTGPAGPGSEQESLRRLVSSPPSAPSRWTGHLASRSAISHVVVSGGSPRDAAVRRPVELTEGRPL